MHKRWDETLAPIAPDRSIAKLPHEVTSLAFTSDGSALLASFGAWIDAGGVRIWDFESGDLRLAVDTPYPINAVVPAPDGQTFLTCRKAVASTTEEPCYGLWDAASGNPIQLFAGQTSSFQSGLAFSNDGHQCVTSIDALTVAVWDLPGGELHHRLTHPEDWWKASQISCSPTNRWLLTAGGRAGHTGRIALWDLETGEPLGFYEGNWGAVTCLAWSPDGKRFATGAASQGTIGHGRHSPVLLWDADPIRVVAEIDDLLVVDGYRKPDVLINDIAFTRDGRHLILAMTPGVHRGSAGRSPGGAQIHDLVTGSPTVYWEDRKAFMATAVSPTGPYMALGNHDGRIEVWNIAEERLKAWRQATDQRERMLLEEYERKEVVERRAAEVRAQQERRKAEIAAEQERIKIERLAREREARHQQELVARQRRRREGLCEVCGEKLSFLNKLHQSLRCTRCVKAGHR